MFACLLAVVAFVAMPSASCSAIVALSDDENPVPGPAGQASILESVTALSDEEPQSQGSGSGQVVSVPNPAPRVSTQGAKRHVSAHQVRGLLNKILVSQCRCARLSTATRSSCYTQFQAVLESLVQCRVNLAQLHKLDADQQAALSQVYNNITMSKDCSLRLIQLIWYIYICHIL